MVYSMTGYGKARAEEEARVVTTEIKTVNHRYLDIRLYAPPIVKAIEEDVKKVIQQYFQRGTIHVNIHITDSESSPYQVVVDWPLIDQYMEQLEKVKEKYHLSSEIPVDIVTKIPDVFIIEQKKEMIEQIKSLILTSVHNATIETKKSREKEGLFLREDLISRLKNIETEVKLIEEAQPLVIEEYHNRIKERVLYYTKDLANIDENRLHQEIAFLIEKGDVTEEIIRLKSHLTHSMQLFNEEDGKEPIGRKLDFIVQEIHRELNTIGSKAIDERMGKTIVNLKSELEKIREQIQNIE